MKKLILLLTFPFLLSNLVAQSEAYDNPNYREFDFWIGEWDVVKTGTQELLGYSKIDSIVDGFAVQENYKNARSQYQGTSINKFNTATDQWEQFWVDNTGLTLHLKGQKIENQMILQNVIGEGEFQLKNRITWIDHGNGTVQQIWERSEGEDESWSKIFDGMYIKKGTVLSKEKTKKKKKN